MGLLTSVGIASATEFNITDCKISNCTETKLDTGEWIYNCTYIECTKYPHRIGEEINVTVMNCTADDFIDYLENYTSVLESSLNLSEQLLDTRMTRDGYKMNWDSCEDDLKNINGTIKEKQDYIDDECMDKDVCNSQIILWKNNATKCVKDCEEKLGEESFWKIPLFLAGGAIFSFFIWLFKLKRPTLEKTEVMPTMGETSYDPRAVQIDTKIANVNAKREEGEKKILEAIAKIRESKTGTKPEVKEESKDEIKEPGTVEVIEGE